MPALRDPTAANHLQPVGLWHPELKYGAMLKEVGRGRKL